MSVEDWNQRWLYVSLLSCQYSVQLLYLLDFSETTKQQYLHIIRKQIEQSIKVTKITEKKRRKIVIAKNGFCVNIKCSSKKYQKFWIIKSKDFRK